MTEAGTARRFQVLLLFILTTFIPTAGGTEPRIIELALRERLLPTDQRNIRVQQGDDVTLRWTTNHEVLLHLHGYDIEKRIKPRETATMTFRARAAGRFPITLHSPGPGSVPATPSRETHEAPVGYLEVHAR